MRLLRNKTIFAVGAACAVLLVFCFLFNVSLAATTGTLRPTADGGDDSANWDNTANAACNTADCYLEVDESTGGSCTNSDGDTSFVDSQGGGDAQTFDIDECYCLLQ